MNDRNDLTQGNILNKLILYFLPIAAGTLFQQLYNAVDAIIVGRFIGTQALAAVGGSPATLSALLIGFFVALSSGAAVIIAQDFGARIHDRLSVEIHTSMTFCGLIGLLLGIFVILLARPILILLQTPMDTLEDAALYTRIYFFGTVFMLLFNMGSGVLRALGDSRRPFIYLAISCILNIVLDLLFVIVFSMGVIGVAWATVIAQAFSAVLVILRLGTAPEEYQLSLSSLCIDRKALRLMMQIGIPSGIQSAMYGVSNLILQIGVNSLGTVVVASWSMGGKIDGVYWALAGAFGTAVTNFIGQNYGAGKYDRVKKCTKQGALLFSGVTAAMSLLLLGIARPLLSVFTSDAVVIATTWRIMKFFIPYYLLWTCIEVFSGVLRGVGDAVNPMVIIALGVCVLRVVWVLTVFRASPGLITLSVCYPISWAVTDIALLIYYYRGSIIHSLKCEGKM